jgi:4,5-dihydroxyphthalate decarboxylase
VFSIFPRIVRRVTTADGLLELSAALGNHARARPLADGSVAPAGIRLLGTTLGGSETFWRQLKFAEFDVSEMSMSSLVIATSHGPTPWVAIPVFTRLFHYTGALVRIDRGIDAPADLRGKRLGVPEYQQTAALWSRGILKDHFGVDPADIEWYMERPPEVSHGGSTGFTPPPGIRLQYIPRDTNMGEMVADGRLDGALLYIPLNNLVDRSRIDLRRHPMVRPLFPDARAETRRFYAATGIFPINHTVVVRRSILERHPWVARSLYDAFQAVKTTLRAQHDDNLAPYFATGLLNAAERTSLAKDPYEYGITATRPVLETITRYAHDQGLTKRVVALDEIFAPSTMDL